MRPKVSPKFTMVEDVPIPKSLLASKFNSPLDMARWEKTLPANERVPYEFAASKKRNEVGGVSRSASLHTTRVQRPPTARQRPRSNPPELTSKWEPE